MTPTKNIETTMSRRMNGVELDKLMATVNAIKAEPELGACRFRARNTWMTGNHNRTSVKGFYGAKQDIDHKQTFTMDAGEPAILAGNDEGANPVEHLLHALASCLTTSMVAHAAVRGIEIEELESESKPSPKMFRGSRTWRLSRRSSTRSRAAPMCRSR